MRHTFFLILSAILVAFFATGCADDLRNRNMFDAGTEEVAMSFSVEKVASTRAEDGQDIESVIDHAYLLFYPSHVSNYNSVPIAAVRAEISTSDPASLSFKMPLRLEPDTDYKLLAIANADAYLPDGFTNFADYLQTWCANSQNADADLLLYYADRILSSEIDCLPMRGGVVEDAPFRFTMQNGSYKVSASLSFRRLVARIDVANITKDLKIEGVALCNWRNSVSVADEVDEFGNRAGKICGILSDEDADTDDSIFLNMPVPDYSGVQQLQKSIYSFPSNSEDAYSSDKTSTALILKAKYKDDSESTYYRVNIGSKGNRSELKTNTKYLVTI